MASITHVVWDWNGTLFDDWPLLAEASSTALVAIGGEPFTEESYRTTFVRPIQAFYESQLGRSITEDEWLRIDDVFHDTYDALSHRADLATDAREALEAVGDRGLTQSVLSMWRHDRLVPFVGAIGIHDHFTRIDGLQHAGGGHKAPHLEAHIAALGDATAVDGPERVLLVGDTIDDAHAAREVGVRCVLYSGGEHPPERLVAEGYPVVSSLLDAVEAGLGA